MMAAVLFTACLTSCESDEFGGGKTIARFDLANGQALATLGSAQSRATDGEFSGTEMFKLGDDGQLTAIGVFVNEDGEESRSNLTVSPNAVYNLTDNYMAFELCAYYDADGDRVTVSDEYHDLIVRRSDGLIFSTIGIGGSHYISFKPDFSSFVEDGAGRLLACFWGEPGCIGRITLSNGKGTWEQLSTDSSPIMYSEYPRVFAMARGLVGATAYRGFGTYASVIYPNGGYDVFNDHTGTSMVLDEGILELSNNPKYIHLGTAYGESTVEDLPWNEYLDSHAQSWYETSDKVIFKGSSNYNDRSLFYASFDKRTKATTAIKPEYEDNLELWKENLCSDGRFYGVASENGKILKAVSFDPVTLDYTTKDLNIANEIDITYIANDSRNAKAQMTGTRRSDGYKVAVSVNLKTAETDIIFSDPNRAIISLIPLN